MQEIVSVSDEDIAHERVKLHVGMEDKNRYAPQKQNSRLVVDDFYHGFVDGAFLQTPNID